MTEKGASLRSGARDGGGAAGDDELSDGWTAAIAIAGVVGTLSAAFGVPMLTDRLRRRRERRVAFRLVGMELALIGAAIVRLLQLGRAPDSNDRIEQFLPRSAWDAYQAVLALELKDTSEWEAVAIIYLWTVPFVAHAQQNPGHPYDDEIKRNMGGVAADAFGMARRLGVTERIFPGSEESPFIAGGATGGANPS